MKPLMKELNARRTYLVAQCKMQREEIALHISRLEKPLTIIDSGIHFFSFLRQHPMAVMATGVLLNRFHFTKAIRSIIEVRTIWSGLLKLKSFIKSA